MRRLIIISIIFLASAGSVLAQENLRTLWDINATPKVGANYSTFSGADNGEWKLGVTAGGSIELVLTPKLSFDIELTFSHEGCHNYVNPATQQQNDARLNIINTDYTFRYYPSAHGTFNVFAGVHGGYLATAKVNRQSFKKDFRRGLIGIPIGVGYEWRHFTVDAKYIFNFNHLAGNKRAKRNLGDVNLMTACVTLGYKIKVF